MGRFLLCDPDVVDDGNLNGKVGASCFDANTTRLRVDVVSERVGAIDPEVHIANAAKPWQAVAQQLRSYTAVFGCVDSFSARSQLEALCQRFLIPHFDIGMDVTRSAASYTISGQAIVSMPGYPCTRCLGLIADEVPAAEAQQY